MAAERLELYLCLNLFPWLFYECALKQSPSIEGLFFIPCLPTYQPVTVPQQGVCVVFDYSWRFIRIATDAHQRNRRSH